MTSASAALKDATADLVVGALPFDCRSKAALLAPVSVTFGAALPPWPTAALPTVRIVEMLPAPEQHRARIGAALQRLNEPGSPLQKVVLARALRLVADDALDLATVVRRLSADPEATVYLADLSPAGGDYTGTALVGASPELLVARSSAQVSCQPFAGSAPRSSDPEADAANGAALAASAKNRHEHQLVVDAMRTALEPLCSRARRRGATSAQQHRGAVAPVHPDPRQAARNIHYRN